MAMGVSHRTVDLVQIRKIQLYVDMLLPAKLAITLTTLKSFPPLSLKKDLRTSGGWNPSLVSN